MASLALVPARRFWLATAFVGALLLLVVPAAQAQETTTQLPSSVEAAVIAAAATEAGAPESDVEILRAEAVTWNNGCLGAQADDEFCTEALVEGYVAWVLAGGTVHRFHTDATSEVRLGQTGILNSAVATAPLPSGATAVISGEIPTSGVALFQVMADASTERIRAALEAQGCATDSLARTVSGRWLIYGFDSPDFANAGFFAADGAGSGVVPAETILLTSCEGGAPTPTPAPTPEGFSTEDVDESTRNGTGALANVEVGDHDDEGFERIVFEFAAELGETTLTSTVPPYTIGYETDPTACGSGFDVDIDGEAMLVANFPTTLSYDPDTGDALVTEPDVAGLDSIASVEQSCAFEGVTTWVFGIDSEAGFRVSEQSSPTRLVIDVATGTGASQ